MSKKTRRKALREMTNAEKVARLFNGAYGYDKGLSIQIIAQYLYNGDSPYKLQLTRAAIGNAKWHWLKVGYVLGSVDGINGYRYCLVAAPEEAERVQSRLYQNATGNLYRALQNEPVLVQAGLLKEPKRERLGRLLELTEGLTGQ